MSGLFKFGWINTFNYFIYNNLIIPFFDDVQNTMQKVPCLS